MSEGLEVSLSAQFCIHVYMYVTAPLVTNAIR